MKSDTTWRNKAAAASWWSPTRTCGDSHPVAVTLDALRGRGIDAVLFDQSSVEPTDLSFKEAIAFAVNGRFDGYVAVGGGSSMDTCKAANLFATWPADFMTYVNPPIGKGTPVPGPLKPMMAIPTTAGTGSETTGVTIFDYLEMGAKTGIASRALRPIRGIIDLDNTRTLPRMVAACTGLDQLTHALEALTTLPYNQRPAPEHPRLRPAYQGANPISDVWASRAIELIAKNLIRAMEDPSDDEARAGGAARRHLCRHRLRKRRPAPGPWHVVPGIGNGQELRPRWVSPGTPDRPPRHGGLPQCAGRVPFHGAGQPVACICTPPN